jgi:hypothetical protein
MMPVIASPPYAVAPSFRKLRAISFHLEQIERLGFGLRLHPCPILGFGSRALGFGQETVGHHLMATCRSDLCPYA